MRDTSDNWTVRKVGEIVSSIDGGISVKASDRPARSGEHGILTLSAVSYGNFDPSANKAVLDGATDALGRSVRANTVLITRSNTVALVGMCVYVDRDSPTLHLPDLIWELSLDQDRFDPKWFHYALSSQDCRLQIERRATGTSGSMKKLSMASLKTIDIPVPPLCQQRAIATLLGIWDSGIHQLTDLITAKIRVKQGLMRQLLTGKRRFSGYQKSDVRPRRLHEFLTLTPRPVERPSVAYKALGLRSHGKGTFFRLVEDPDKVFMNTLYQVKKDDLILNITFAWEGAVAIVSEADEQALVSHRFPTFVVDRSKALPEYLRQLVITPWFKFEMGLVSPGGAGRNRVLNKREFLNIFIPLPQLDEQAKTASFLSLADQEISLLSRQLEILKKQKHGVMQKLLTGEVRVRVSRA
jgi:type I restriction enzyme, S subunit